MALVNAATKAARHEDPTPYPYTAAPPFLTRSETFFRFTNR
jgi:hypothetical protein